MNLHIPGIVAQLGLPSGSPQARLPADQSEVLHCDNAGIGVRQGVIHQEDGLCAAIVGNYYWRDRELSDRFVRRGAREALAFAYRQHGEGLLAKLGGRFSLLIWNAQERSALLATDRLGISPVYWAAREGQLLTGAAADQVLALGGLARELSAQSLYNYLFFHMVPSPDSIYQGVHKLPAAHALRFRDGRAETFCYWVPEFSENDEKNTSEAGAEMLQLLETSVAQLSEGATTGAFLSGGLDSSTVAGMLSNRQADGADTFSMGFDAEGYDEIAFARIANTRFGARGHEYYVTPEDVLDALPQVAAAYDEPFGNSSAIPAYFCARLAREHGMQRLLAGDGGDELFAGNERYAKQTVFELYHALPQGLRRRVVQPLASRLPQRSLLGKISSYVRQASVPLPARLHSYNFLTRIDEAELFEPEFLAQVDTEHPFRLEEAVHQRPQEASRLNRMLYLDWQFTLADNDLRKVNRMCQLAGIEVEYPMLDDMVVEFSTRVSSFRKMRFNKLRSFYKDAVSDFLPPQIINKSKHGFGLPFGVWMAEHAGLQALAREQLTNFEQRGIVRPQFVEQLWKMHGQSHAGYYGELVWVLVMLELWLSRHS